MLSICVIVVLMIGAIVVGQRDAVSISLANVIVVMVSQVICMLLLLLLQLLV